MLQNFGTWLIRKGIWFLLILIGFIAYWNLHPVWIQLEEQVAEATTAAVEAPKAVNLLRTLQTSSLEKVKEAKSLTKTELDQRIAKEESNIQQLRRSLEESQGLGIHKALNRIVISGQLDFSQWLNSEYTSLRSRILNDAERARAIPIKRVELQQKEDEYIKKKIAYDQIAIGFGSNNTVNSIASSGISQLNKLIEGTAWEVKDANKAYRELEVLYSDIKMRRGELDSLLNPSTLPINTPPSVEPWLNKINESERSAQAKLESSWLHTHIIQPAKEYWHAAFLALGLAIIFSPLSRVICYYLLAPIASRQSPIVFSDHQSTADGVKKHSESGSGSGLTIHLDHGDTLLVHHDYAKTLPKQCRTRTQVLLDAKSPFTSFFSGLYNLLRIEPQNTISLEISAGHDGLNELICIDLKEDTGVVIEPRNLVGVVIKHGALAYLHKHWVIGRLQSWLKWQFRYVTVSGPLTLILKGARGLTVSNVIQELTIAPEYVVGFSSNLSYGTARTETFGGYYSRKKSLLNNRFIGNQGVVIHQEANFESIAHVRKSGLEGVVDGLLKAFGI